MISRIFSSSLAALALALPAIVHADEASVKRAVEAWVGEDTKVDAVRRAGFLDLYEVQVGNDLLYTDEKVGYVIIGNVIDVKAKKDLTDERKAKLSQIKFSDLPLNLAIKQVKGSGKRVVATFEDPNCTYCRKLAKEMQGFNDVTIYTFLYPILSPDSMDKSKAIWCAPDRAKAWNDLMLSGILPAAGNCDAPVEKVVALGRKLKIHGTPTIFLSNGNRIPGFMPGPQLDRAISRAGGG